MPSKLKKAIAAVKDQTSISLAKVGGAESSSLEVAILKATTHEEIPVDERHITEVLQLVSSNRSYAGSCARAIGRRVGRTRSWVVAVKSLMLVLRILQDGDPHFPKEVLHAMKRGYKILNLSSFRDDSSTSCPWDFTAFVRTFALYLDERLDCFLTGKLQRRTYSQSGFTRSTGASSRKKEPIIRDMKPGILLDRISHWQRLLDRAIATRPTGAAKTNRLVQTCLYAIVQETFELYRDISDGLALLLDSFFHLHYNNCVSAFQTCVKASKQFEELCSFYDLCKSIGVGRTSEYPSVHKVSDELVETLQEFLKDQSSFPGTTNDRKPGTHLPLPGTPSPKGSESGSVRKLSRAVSEFSGSQCTSQCTSLEDLISADAGFSPDRYSDPSGEKQSTHMEDFLSANDTTSIRSDPTDHRGFNSALDLLSFPSPPPELQEEEQSFDQSNHEGSSSSSKHGWELALFETSTQSISNDISNNNNGFDHNYNPFLQDSIDLNTNTDLFGAFTQTTVAAGSNSGFPVSGFPAGLDLGIDSTIPPTFQTDDFSAGFPADLGIVSTNYVQPTFQVDNFSSGLTSINNGDEDFSVDFFGEVPPNTLNNGGLSASPTFLDNFPGDLSANDMNAIVPFDQVNNNHDLFFMTPTFQATPTFRATNSEMDQEQSNLQNENDPFGSFPDITPSGEQKMSGSLDQQSLLKQQELWFQNQNKIMARHLT